MRSLGAVVLAALLVLVCLGVGPAYGDEENSADDSSGQGGAAGGEADSGEGDKGDKGDGAESSDPWNAPDLPKDSSEPAGDSQVVVPDTYPTAEIDRPFVLPALVLEPRAGIILDFIQIRRVDNQFAAFLGAGFGVVDDLEAGVGVPLLFSPRVRGGDLQVYGMYDLSGLLDDLFHLAARLDLIVPLSDRYSYYYAGDFICIAQALGKYKIVDMLALVADLGMGFGLYPGDNAFLFLFDFGALVQPLDALAFELTFGVHVFKGNNAEVNAVPLRLKVQYTVIGDLDLFVETAFLDLNDWGADWFQMIAGAAFRIGF